MRKLSFLAAFVLAAGLMLVLTVAADGPDYQIAGTYFETCSCDPSCPCIFTSDPTQGHCKASLVWKIDEGHSGKTDLSGTTVVVTLVADGNMGEQMGKFKGAMYLEDSANDEQRKALAELFSARFGPMFGSMAGPKVVSIETTRKGDNYSVKIPKILDFAIEPMKSPDGSVSKISDAPFAMTSEPLMVAKSVRHKYEDEGLDAWDMGAGRSAFFSTFNYASDGD